MTIHNHTPAERKQIAKQRGKLARPAVRKTPDIKPPNTASKKARTTTELERRLALRKSVATVGKSIKRKKKKAVKDALTFKFRDQGKKGKKGKPRS